MKHAALLDRLYRQVHTHVADWKRHFARLLAQGGVTWSSQRSLDARIQPGTHECEQCGNQLGSLQKLTVHQFLAHRTRREERKLAYGTRCCICLREYHTRTRYVRHLMRRESLCFSLTRQLREPISPEDLAKLEGAEARRLRSAKHAGVAKADD